MVYILIAILIFGVLIAVHEFGHFLAAKACGVRVNEFSIGMGPQLFHKTKGDTEYSLRLLPIGGYCAMEGEDEDSDDDRALGRQVWWKKFIIFVAGAFMNFLTGLIIVICLYAGAQAFYTTEIVELNPDFPQQGEDGLMPGDTIYAINGERIYLKSDVSLIMGLGDTGTIQSMCNTHTEDAKATIAQIHALEEAGCEIVRVTVPNMEAAHALSGIKENISIPLVADIHFDYRLAVEAAALCIQRNEYKTSEAPNGFIKEGGMHRKQRVNRNALRSQNVLMRLQIRNDRWSGHSPGGRRIGTERLHVEKISPSSNRLSENHASGGQVNKRQQLHTAQPAHDNHDDQPADDAAVNGQPSLPDIKNIKRVGCVVFPGKGDVIETRAHDAADHAADHNIQRTVGIDAKGTCALEDIANCQQKRTCNDDSIPINRLPKQRKRHPVDRKIADSKPREGNCLSNFIHAVRPPSYSSRGRTMESADFSGLNAICRRSFI